jgi:transcriptional regulator with XRE-family HTH domain
MSNLSERLKLIRKERNLRQTDVAESCGIALRSYKYYEQGERKPDSDTLLKLCNYFYVSPGYLLGKHDEVFEAEMKERFPANFEGALQAALVLKKFDEYSKTDSISDLLEKFENKYPGFKQVLDKLDKQVPSIEELLRQE